MIARVSLALTLLLSSLSLAAAQQVPRMQPQIPSSEMPGRERERFEDRPNLMQQWSFPEAQTPLIKKKKARKCRTRGSQRAC